MFRTPVLLLALLISSPALWQALVSGSMPIQTALIRFLVGIPVAAVMAFAFRSATGATRRRRPTMRPDASLDGDLPGSDIAG